MVRYVGTPTPTGLVRGSVPEAVIGEGQVQAWVVGPGLDPESTGEEAAAQLRMARDALAGDRPVVVDAGGLDLVTGTRTAPTLLTPHAGELACLVTCFPGQPTGTRHRTGGGASIGGHWTPVGRPVTREDVEWEPVRHARLAAELTGATVLLKGSTTLVVGPGSRTGRCAPRPRRRPGWPRPALGRARRGVRPPLAPAWTPRRGLARSARPRRPTARPGRPATSTRSCRGAPPNDPRPPPPPLTQPATRSSEQACGSPPKSRSLDRGRRLRGSVVGRVCPLAPDMRGCASTERH